MKPVILLLIGILVLSGVFACTETKCDCTSTTIIERHSGGMSRLEVSRMLQAMNQSNHAQLEALQQRIDRLEARISVLETFINQFYEEPSKTEIDLLAARIRAARLGITQHLYGFTCTTDACLKVK